MKLITVILFFLISTLSFGQVEGVINDDFYQDYVIDETGDTTYSEPVRFHFPIQDYLDINSDRVEAYMLSCYSKTMQHLEEPILYNLNFRQFIRIVVLEQETSTSYRIEPTEKGNYKLIVKRLNGNYENPGALFTDSLTLTEDEYTKITRPLLESCIWAIKPHSVNYYALDEKNMILFESNIYGGYNFTDIYIPFTENNRFFKDFYKSLRYIKNCR